MRILAAILALALSGCLVPLRTDEMFGEAETTGFRASPVYRVLSQTATVDLSGTVRARGTEDLTVTLYLVEGACGSPQAEPEEWLARDVMGLRDPEDARSLPFASTLQARVTPGTEYAAIASVQADNVIGPIFPRCVGLRAM